MGTLPSLTKTWRFQVNQATAAGGSALAGCQNLLYAIKASLIGGGAWTDSAGAGAAAAGNWTVIASSDSVAADGTDRWAAAGNVVFAAVGVAHSWIVLQQTGVGATFQLLIDCTTGGGTTAYIAVSASAGFAGGTTLNRPTATDEVRLCNTTTWGGPAANVASTLHVLRSTDGSCNRVLICRAGFAVGYWCIDALTEADASWSIPFIGCVNSNAGSAADTPIFANLSAVSSLSYTYVPGGFAAAAYFGSEYSRQFGAMYAQAVANDMGASWPIIDINIYSELCDSKGWLGRMIDQWYTSATLVTGDTFPVAGPTNNFAVFGDTVQQWNTTEVTTGVAAPTNRDGEWVTYSYGSATHLTPVSSSPFGTSTTVPILPTVAISFYYIMQANDSVTGARYDWRVPNTPDWAGVSYPGPNAATNVSIAGVRES